MKLILEGVVDVLKEQDVKSKVEEGAAIVLVKDKKPRLAEFFERIKGEAIGATVTDDDGKTQYVVFGKSDSAVQLVGKGGTGLVVFRVQKSGDSEFIYIDNKASLKKYM
uniref:Uncharacterized protein n=1 Tax=Rhizobium phage IG49 TaxID=3129228 RepID=A0AAU8HYB8_9CAUD